MKLPSALTKNTRLPLILAPMFLVSGVDLVLKSCHNGIIGSFPVSNARTIEQLEEWMANITNTVSASKGSAQWALNMIMHSSYPRFDEELELVMKYKPPIVITALGSPIRVVDHVHSYGGLVFADVNSLPFARKASTMGVDGLILVSAGAGGHTGRMTGFAFVEAVREFWDGILILAGGMSTGRSIRAAQTLGADMAYMGTRFIATEESMAVTEYKDMLLRTVSDDLVLTDAITGVPAYFIRESLLKANYDPENLISAKIDFTETHGSGKAWKDIWSAGQGVGMLTKIDSVKEIVDELVVQYRQTIEEEKTTQW